MQLLSAASASQAEVMSIPSRILGAKVGACVATLGLPQNISQLDLRDYYGFSFDGELSRY
jgi:hypothetical protein